MFFRANPLYSRRRIGIKLTLDEADYLLDVLQRETEAYQNLEGNPDVDDDMSYEDWEDLHDDMAMAIDIRSRIWARFRHYLSTV